MYFVMEHGFQYVRSVSDIVPPDKDEDSVLEWVGPSHVLSDFLTSHALLRGSGQHAQCAGRALVVKGLLFRPSGIVLHYMITFARARDPAPDRPGTCQPEGLTSS